VLVHSYHSHINGFDSVSNSWTSDAALLLYHFTLQLILANCPLDLNLFYCLLLSFFGF